VTLQGRADRRPAEGKLQDATPIRPGVEVGSQRQPAYMVINGRPEPRWWREDDDAEANWHSDARPGPGSGVDISANGIALYAVPSIMGPAEARWLAARMLEAAGIYEACFRGDGSRLTQAPSYPPIQIALPPSAPEPVDTHLHTAPLEAILGGITEETDSDLER
jgi:hypothetical protein